MESFSLELAGSSLKLYALMTPPAVLSAFLGAARTASDQEKRKIAFKTSCAIFIIAAILYFCGSGIFEYFGFTLDAFRIGSGVLLLLNGISLMKDADPDAPIREGDISIVPLAIPLGMGPASIGAVMVMGATAKSDEEILVGFLSLSLAALGIYALLRMGDVVGRILGATGIAILGKLTGLLLAALAAQVICTGATGFLEL